MNNRVDPAFLNVRMSPIVSISEDVRKITKETGKQFVLFQRGEMDFKTPEYIRAAAKKALDNGLTKYPASGGEEILKDAILIKLRTFNGAEGLTRDNIICTYGGQEALELVFRLFAHKKGAGFAPVWSCVLENFVPFCDTQFTEVPLRPDFSVDYDHLEKIISGVTFFYLNSPHNPTGKVFTSEEVSRIVGLCEKYGVYLLSDEAYERITYDGKTHVSPLATSSNLVIGAFSLSKTYSMTGWRIGYLVCRDPELAKALKLGNYTQTAGVVTFVQHAAKEAISNAPEEKVWLATAIRELTARRDVLVSGLERIPGVTLSNPEGAFYVFPNFTQLIPSAVQGPERNTYIYKKLLNAGVATVFGSCFGEHFVDNLRISFSMTPVDVIEEGVARIQRAIEA